MLFLNELAKVSCGITAHSFMANLHQLTHITWFEHEPCFPWGGCI